MYMKILAALAVAAASASAAGDVSSRAALDRAANGSLQVAEPVAPGVHVLRQRDTVFTGVIGNVTIVEQSDGIVLLDSGASHGSGQRVVELVRRISDMPVKAVVITHWHNDHPLGLSAIREAWPDVEIIAHEAAAADMAAGRLVGVPRERSQQWEAERAESLRRSYAELEAGDVAQAQTPEERDGWRGALAALTLRLADLAGTHLVFPTRTFSGQLTLPDRIAPIELLFLGRANTSGDISAWLPRQRILVAGDAVVAPVPYMFNVYPSEMLQVFERMRTTGHTILVPGHGEVQRDGEYLARLERFVREVQRQVEPLARSDVPADQVVGRTDFSGQRTAFTGGDPWLGYWFDRYSLQPLVDSVYREARGEQLGPPPVSGQ